MHEQERREDRRGEVAERKRQRRIKGCCQKRKTETEAEGQIRRALPARSRRQAAG